MEKKDNTTETKEITEITATDKIKAGLSAFGQLQAQKKQEEADWEAVFLSNPERFILENQEEIYNGANGLRMKVNQALSSQKESFKQLALRFGQNQYLSEFAAENYEKSLAEFHRYEELLVLVRNLQPYEAVTMASVNVIEGQDNTVNTVEIEVANTLTNTPNVLGDGSEVSK